MASQKAGEEKVAEDKERKERGERKEKGKRKKGKKKAAAGRLKRFWLLFALVFLQIGLNRYKRHTKCKMKEERM